MQGVSAAGPGRYAGSSAHSGDVADKVVPVVYEAVLEVDVVLLCLKHLVCLELWCLA